MRILHVTHGYFPEGGGGVEGYLRTVLLAQRAAGHDARLLTGSFEKWDTPGVEEIEVDGVPVWRVHRDDMFFDHFARLYHPGVEQLVRELLASARPDVVHVHQWIRLTCNLVEICAQLGIPAVVTLHDLYTSCPRCFRVRPGDEACFRPLSLQSCRDCVPRFGWESAREIDDSIELYRDQYQAELGMARTVLVASTATADLIAESTGFPRERLQILPLAYQPRFPDGAPEPEPLPVGNAAFRFGYWGNLTYRKGAQLLLRAFRSLCTTGVPRAVELHLFGGVDTDALKAELEQLAHGLPVRFHGRYEYRDLAAAGLHMAVFPMLCFETHGFVLDECFELGLPCVLTDIGAMPARAGDAALRVPPQDPDALSEALRGVLERPQLRDELRQRVPGPSPTVAEHTTALEAIYRAARSSQPRAVEPIPPERRALLLLLQRESAQDRIAPEHGPR